MINQYMDYDYQQDQKKREKEESDKNKQPNPNFPSEPDRYRKEAPKNDNKLICY